ncbi:DH domain-containing protein [Aphelenchoides bicaudatus]|nr:DH domain-containing protein [Aphelenchoides bicaudatus]
MIAPQIYQILLEYKLNETVKNSFPLHWACFCGNENRVRQLLIYDDIDPNGRDSNNFSSLHIAVANNNLEIVKILLENGAKVNIADNDRGSPLHYTCYNGNVECAKLLLDNRANPNAMDKEYATPLHYACQKGNIDCIKLLLTTKININATDNNGTTPLHIVCDAGYLDCCKTLLDAGADVNIVDECHFTPLHYTGQNGHLQCCQLLLESGARVNSIDSQRKTALHYASYNGHLGCCHLLLQKAANSNALDKDYLTPLHEACFGGYLECCQILLEYEATVNVRNKYNETPLHISIHEGHLDCATLLLYYKADPNTLNKYNYSPLHTTCIHGYLDGCQLLLENGADVNITGKYSNTPLHVASKKGHAEVVSLLLNNGANPKLKNWFEKTAFELAEKSGQVEKLPMLKDAQSTIKTMYKRAINTKDHLTSRLSNLPTNLPNLLQTPSVPSIFRTPSSKSLASLSQEDRIIVRQSVITTGEPDEVFQVVNQLSKIDLIIEELLKTESSYISDLNAVIKYYLTPFENPANRKEIPEGLRGQSMAIFGNIRDLFEFHNNHFFNDLMRAHKSPGQLCQIFIKRQESLFGQYVYYCNRVLPGAQTLCREHSADSCKLFVKCQKQAEHKLPLSFYLMTPFQRIQRYPLLLRELLDACNKDATIDDLVCNTVEEALTLMSKLVSRINASTEQENKELREQLAEAVAKSLQLIENDKDVLFEDDNHPSTSATPSPTSPKRNEQICTICLEKPIDKVAVIKCGHTFCHTCIQKHTSIYNNCPNCQGEIVSLLKLYE